MNFGISIRRSTPAGEATEHAVVQVTDNATIADVAQALNIHPGEMAPDYAPDTSLTDAQIFSGAVIPPSPEAAYKLPAETKRLEIVGGPFAGEVCPLFPGRPLTIGTAEGNGLIIADPYLASEQLTLTVSVDNELNRQQQAGMLSPLNVDAKPSAEATPMYLNGELVEGPFTMVPADILQLGSSVMRVGLEPAPDADIHGESHGTLAYNRASRIQLEAVQPVVNLPGNKPDAREKTPLPWLSALIPIVMGVSMAVIFNRPFMLMMAFAAPVMVIGSFLTNRKRAKRQGIATIDTWREDVEKATKRLSDLSKQQRLNSWYETPDPVLIRDIATSPTNRLWERRITDADAVELRVGVTQDDLDVKFEGAGTSDKSEIRRVSISPLPVVADLAAGVVGIAGPVGITTNLARAMVTQLATLRSPRDASIVIVCDDSRQVEWEWAQWLPHLDGGFYAHALIGNTDDTRRERIRELSAQLEYRQKSLNENKSLKFPKQHFLFIDGTRELRTIPGMVSILEHGPSFGIFVVALDTDRSRLPEECQTEIVVDPQDLSMARFESRKMSRAHVLLDGISVPTAELISRSLQPIEHVGGAGDDNVIPQSVRFVDLVNLNLDDPSNLLLRWAYTPRQTQAVVGAGPEGEFALDLAKDGPHGLVAGTTGAGKSEFLQTFVVSLALANRPDALNFVLVDYKGGSAFADCERLDHTVGLVTNLDGRETERALESLDAEIKRREHVLRGMAAKDADAAWEKDADAASKNGLARLVIVIDEFAELKTELPDFVAGLVRIARVGRSLGIHLILATQRPSGAITPEMQSNTNLRVALRVTDKADSTDIINAPDAALISPSQPGRGYARRGFGSAPSPFQTARVAGNRPGAKSSGPEELPAVSLDWSTVGRPVRFPKKAAPKVVDHDDTDLRAIVNLINSASAATGIPKNPSPWLDPLPPLITLPEYASHDLEPFDTVIGTEDVPSEQAQRPFVWNIATDSHLMLIGGAQSGRTSTIRLIANQVVQNTYPSDVHMYALDYGNGALLPLVEAPHCGAVITPMESGRLTRFTGRLLMELGRRQRLLSQLGVGDITDQRRSAAPGAAFPYIVVLFDGWERVQSTVSPDEYLAIREDLLRILREGPTVGIRLIMSSDRSAINDKLSNFIEQKLIYPLNDPNDYRAAGIPTKQLPKAPRAGQVFFGMPLREVQTAMLSAEASGESENNEFRGTVDHVAAHYAATPLPDYWQKPFRVDTLPDDYPLSSSYALPQAEGRSGNIILGLGGDELSTYSLDWLDRPGGLILGERGSGRSSAMATVAHQLHWQQHPVIVVALKDSPLRPVAAADGLLCFESATTSEEEVEAAIAALGEGKLAVLIDDAEALKDTPLETQLLKHKQRMSFLVSTAIDNIAGAFNGPIAEAKRAQQGLILWPTSSIAGSTAFSTPVPKTMLGKDVPGRGVFFVAGEYISVQVPNVMR